MSESWREDMRRLAAGMDEEALRYWQRNERRFAVLLDDARALAATRKIGRVLDIGPSFQTRLLAREFPSWQLDTFGFDDRRFTLPPPSRHWVYDLNECDRPGRIEPPAEGYDLVLFLEVIEHLPLAPRVVLAELRRWIAPGGTLVVSTPNALWLKHRIKLLMGRHPYELIREDKGNPGHFREYTAGELDDIGRSAGLVVERVEARCVYQFSGAKDRFYAWLAMRLGPTFARDLTLVLRRVD
jgi:SAM-dependent methyltransferase